MSKVLGFLVAMIMCGPATPLFAQSQSASAAKNLASLMETRKLESVAARMPGETDRFVAALYNDAQLLVISTRYAQPTLLREKLLTGKYRDAYVALNSGGDQATRFFVMDLGADGLSPARSKEGRFDIVYEQGTKETRFDGNWKTQSLSKSDYDQAFDAADQRYASMLAALAAQLTPQP